MNASKPSNLQFYFATTVLISSIVCLTLVYRNWPQNVAHEEPLSNYLKTSFTVGDAKKIGNLILRYKDNHYYTIFGAYFASYILLQSLCIPGSIVLSILAGYLFPAPVALLIICTCSTLGASTFYIISKHLFFSSLHGQSNSRVEKFNRFVQKKLEQYKSNLFICVFLLRATPVFPNWTINLYSPIINLPFRPFVLGTFTGVAPLSVIHVWTGRILNDLSSDQSLINWQSIVMTSLVAISLVLLVYIKRFI